MPCTLTAFSVKIVSSGETAIKEAIAREALYEWNAGRSWEEKRAFLPLFLESAAEAATPAMADLLVAFFRASHRTAGPVIAADSEMAIHLRSGRPALIYISEARSDLDEVDVVELENFKSSFPAEAIIDAFKDEKEFRAKFAQKLETLIRYHSHFQIGGEISSHSSAVPVEVKVPATVNYSEDAKTLLMDACDDPEAYLARMNDSRGLKIQVNGRQYIVPRKDESAVRWDKAFGELLQAGLIRDAGYNGQLYQISSKGFEFLATLGKHPIGYIAELGSV